MDLKYLISFGDQVPLNQFKPDDTISILSFSSDGRFLASGDYAGRAVIFQMIPPKNQNGKYQVLFGCQLHAHKSEFDYFRSELSEMKINSLKWVPSSNLNPNFITCNSHDAKLWRIMTNSKVSWTPKSGNTIDEFILPKVNKVDTKISFEYIKKFNDLHSEYLIDIQCLSDQHSFLMVDVCGVSLWDFERDIPNVPLISISQSDADITASATHSTSPFAFLIADDDGNCEILDMRQQAENLTPSIKVNVSNFLNHKGYDGVQSVSSVVFAPDGNSFFARTFGEIQQWDLRNTSKPAAALDVQWFPKQADFLSNEGNMRDQFRTTVTHDGKVLTGQYMTNFVAWDPRLNKVTNYKAYNPKASKEPPEPGKDFTKRVTCVESHPTANLISCVSTAALYLYRY